MRGRSWCETPLVELRVGKHVGNNALGHKKFTTCVSTLIKRVFSSHRLSLISIEKLGPLWFDMHSMRFFRCEKFAEIMQQVLLAILSRREAGSKQKILHQRCTLSEFIFREINLESLKNWANMQRIYQKSWP